MRRGVDTHTHSLCLSLSVSVSLRQKARLIVVSVECAVSQINSHFANYNLIRPKQTLKFDPYFACAMKQIVFTIPAPNNEQKQIQQQQQQQQKQASKQAENDEQEIRKVLADTCVACLLCSKYVHLPHAYKRTHTRTHTHTQPFVFVSFPPFLTSCFPPLPLFPLTSCCCVQAPLAGRAACAGE